MRSGKRLQENLVAESPWGVMAASPNHGLLKLAQAVYKGK
jgi:hypothetical protein